MEICEQPDFLSTILFIKKIIELIQMIIPIILIIMSAIDLGKMVINPDDKSALPNVIKRMMAAVTIFFVPYIVNIVLLAAGQNKFSETECWANANKETISTLSSLELAEEEARKKAQQEKEKQEAEEEAKREQEENDTEYDNDDLYHENGIDGKVEVIDGVFYKPYTNTSGTEGTKGSGPYGYNKYFYERLELFLEEAKKAGHDIRMSTSEYGAWRPYEYQKYFYDCYITKSCNNGNLAAVPGTSNHGWGIASDLSYYSGEYGVKEAKYWAHENAAKYGLSFPLCENIRGYCQEDWHIQPAKLIISYR